MRVIQVEKTNYKSNNNDIRYIAEILNEYRREQITHCPWKESYPYIPNVSFVIAYNNDFIFLKYYVKEKEIRVTNNTINGSVWEDSCVEFFISLREGDPYYNFEFNCIGTPRVGYGNSNKERVLLDEKDISKINTFSSISKQGKDNFEWELTVAIPFELFTQHHYPDWIFEGMNCWGNFYKCGDNLTNPHFLAWMNIEHDSPNFHLPAFFGVIAFQ